MKIKYALYPGWVRSINDGEEHYISARILADLYEVPMHECVEIDPRAAWELERYGTWRGMTKEYVDSLLPLHVMEAHYIPVSDLERKHFPVETPFEAPVLECRECGGPLGEPTHTKSGRCRSRVVRKIKAVLA